MRKLNLWMLAAILTISGAMMMSLASCSSEKDNPVEPVNPNQPEKTSKYTVEQIKNEVMGLSLDPVMYAFTDMMKLYDLDEDGQCAVYELTEYKMGVEEEVTEDELGTETETETGKEVVSVVQYEGTWKVTNDISALGFTDSLDLEGYDLMGTLMLDTKMVFDEDDATPTLMAGEDGKPFELQVPDTIAVLRDTEDGEIFFINRSNVMLIVALSDMGLISDGTENAARALTRAASSDAINQKIEEIAKDERFRTFSFDEFDGNIDLNDWMGVFYKDLNPRICDMTIPGAAAVPSAYIPDGPDPIVGHLKRQFFNIEELWAKGVRYFDLGNCFYTINHPLAFYDTEHKYFNNYITFELAIYRLKRLMEKHPTETAIIMFEEQEPDEKYQNVAGYIYRMLYRQIGDRMLTDYGPDLRLNDCRGKFILMCHIEHPDEEYPLGLNLHSIWSKNGVKQANITFPNGQKGRFMVHNTSKTSLDAVKRDRIMQATKAASESAGSTEPQWFINNLAGAYVMGPGEYNYSHNAYYHNYPMLTFYPSRYSKMGIVVMDFVGYEGRGINKYLDYGCHGSMAMAFVMSKNYYSVRNHTISLDEGDLVQK